MDANITIPTVTEPARNPGWFRPGNLANPTGRPKGVLSGRALALQLLDNVASEHEVKEAIANALRVEAMKHPMRFFKTVLMPLFPKEMLIRAVGEQGAMQWVSYLTSNPTPHNELSPATDISDLGLYVVGDDGVKRELPPPNS